MEKFYLNLKVWKTEENSMENELLRAEEAQRILDKIKEDHDLSKFEELVKDNKIEFEFEDKKYQVRMLNVAEKDELDSLRRKKFGQLIQDKDILLEKDLIRVYKERGLDLEEINEQIRKLDTERYSITLKLGESIADKIGEAVLKEYKNQINNLQDKIYILALQKSSLLTYSLENQLTNYVVKVLTYLSLEIYKDEKYVKAFKSIEDFEKNVNEKLIEKSIYYSMLLN